MKQIILLGIFLGGVLGRPQTELAQAAAATKPNVTIVKNDQTYNDGKGNYNYDIELSDGTKFMQMGWTMPPPAGGNDAEPFLVVKGSYSYVDPDGKTIEVKYTADDKGFHPTEDLIPTASIVSKSAANAAAALTPVATKPVQETAPLQTQ